MTFAADALPYYKDLQTPGPDETPQAFAVVGLDLGKIQDYSALVSLHWEIPRRTPAAHKPSYRAETLFRWPLGSRYETIAAQTADFINRLPPKLHPHLIFDETGCGIAVREMIVRALKEKRVRGSWSSATITAGRAVTCHGQARWSVAKFALVSHLSACLASRRLTVAGTLPESKTLVQELQNFTVKVDPQTGNESFEAWRTAQHDDLVLATTLAVFAAERGIVYQRLAAPPPPSRFVLGGQRRKF